MVPVALALLQPGCSGSTNEVLPAAPTLVTPGSLTAGRTTLLRTYVMDTAFRALPGARIEVLTGESAGVVAIATGEGPLMLRGIFTAATLFRATADDHDPRTRTWTCAVASCGDGLANPYLLFSLNPTAPPVDIAGDYTVTVVVDQGCADIPPDLRERKYGAVVSPQALDGRPAPAVFDLTITDDSMIGRYRGFEIGVAGMRLGMEMHGGHDPVIVEQIAGGGSISISGFAAVTVSGSKPAVITAALDGWIEYLLPNRGMTTCTSTSHQITMRRQ